MSDLINRKELIEKFEIIEEDQGGALSFDAIKDVINSRPTVDAVPVVRGEWIEKESILCKYFSCSHCGGYNEYRTNFCGFCGADMRKKVEE